MHGDDRDCGNCNGDQEVTDSAFEKNILPHQGWSLGIRWVGACAFFLYLVVSLKMYQSKVLCTCLVASPTLDQIYLNCMRNRQHISNGSFGPVTC